MDKSVWIDSNGNEYEEDDEVKVYDHSEPQADRIILDLRAALKDAFDRGRESVYNGEEYMQMVAETAKAEYDKGYRHGYEDAIRGDANAENFHIGDEVYNRFGEKFVITNINGGSVYGFNKDGYEACSLIDESLKTGKTYPWIAEIIKELSE